MSRRKNIYMELVEASNKASNDLYNWKKNCITVNLTLAGLWHNKFHPYRCHSWFDNNFPELVAWRRISDGCYEKMEMVAPRDDIISALQLYVETSNELKTSPLMLTAFNRLIVSLETLDQASIRSFLKDEEELELA